MNSYERQLRDLLIEAIRGRAADFNGVLHYDAALRYVAGRFSHAEIGIVISVCDCLLVEGVLWL